MAGTVTTKEKERSRTVDELSLLSAIIVLSPSYQTHPTVSNKSNKKQK